MRKIPPLALPFLLCRRFPRSLSRPQTLMRASSSPRHPPESNVQTEAEIRQISHGPMNFDAASGARDFAGAEKIANDIRMAFPPKNRFSCTLTVLGIGS